MGAISQGSATGGVSRKRKRPVDAPAKEKQVGTSRKKSFKLADEDYLDTSMGINKSFADMNNLLLADLLAQRTQRFENELSPVELEDLFIPATAIRDTTSWNKPRNLQNLPAFLENVTANPTKLWSSSKKNGAPHTIIVTGAGLRAADLARSIRKFQTKDTIVAKLFAKHIKIKDAIIFLQSNRTGIAVGTPARLNDLMEDGALAIDRLERVVVDASHIDQKKRGVMDMREIYTPLVRWLNRKELKERFSHNGDGIDLIFY